MLCYAHSKLPHNSSSISLKEHLVLPGINKNICLGMKNLSTFSHLQIMISLVFRYTELDMDGMRIRILFTPYSQISHIIHINDGWQYSHSFVYNKFSFKIKRSLVIVLHPWLFHFQNRISIVLTRTKKLDDLWRFGCFDSFHLKMNYDIRSKLLLKCSKNRI